jgi:hypothetical protein
MNRQLILFTLGLILTIPVFQTPIFSRYFEPLPGLHIVKNLPLNMVAGSTYKWTVSFVNPKSEEGFMNITLEITEKKTIIGFGELHVEGTLESYDNPPQKHYNSTLTFTEASGGTFQSLQTQTEKRFNDISLRISSVPNLMPGKYTFTVTITVCYIADMIQSAVEFLQNMYNPSVKLCAEAPKTAPNTYWLVSDNLWAFKALEKYNPKLSKTIKSKLIELAKAYKLPRDVEGLPISYKHEAIIGDTIPASFNTTTQYTLYTNKYTLKTEIANSTAVMEDWQEYADLLLYAALSKHWEGKDNEAIALFNKAKDMWDGVGINDKATKADGTYATYKLALLLYTSKALGQKLDFELQLIATIWNMQDKTTGGIITGYEPDGTPFGDTNTETTSITIIALTQK